MLAIRFEKSFKPVRMSFTIIVNEREQFPLGLSRGVVSCRCRSRIHLPYYPHLEIRSRIIDLINQFRSFDRGRASTIDNEDFEVAI